MRKVGVWTSVAMLAASGATWAGTGGAIDDQAFAVSGQPVVIDVGANDLGIPGVRGLKIRSRPRHGSATVVGGRIRYVPAPNFEGQDRLTYMIVGADATGTATVSVAVGEGLALEGGVIDGVGPGATVTASVGTMEFAAQINDEGRYSLQVPLNADGFVTLGARGDAMQSRIRLASVVGEVERLVLEAGNDRTLSRDENNQVQVNSLSTALARLLRLANADAPIQTDVQLYAAADGVDRLELLWHASAVRIAGRGDYPLPTGIPDTLALIEHFSIVDQFLAEVSRYDPRAQPDASASLVADPDVIVPTDPQDFAREFALVSDLGTAGAINGRYVQGNAVALTSVGTGSFLTAHSNTDPTIVWRSENNIADITPNRPVWQQYFPFLPNAGQVRALSATVRYQLSRLFKGQGGRDLFAVTSTTREVYPDNPELPETVRTRSLAQMGVPNQTPVDRFTPAEVIGSRTLGVPAEQANLPADTYGGSERFTFYADGTARRSVYNETLNWEIDIEGRLLLSLGGVQQAIFNKTKDDGRGALGVLGQWSRDGRRSAKYMHSATYDGFQFDALNAEHSWRGGFSIGDSSVRPSDVLDFVLDADGIAWQMLTTATGTAVTPIGWSVHGGVVELVYYRNGSNQPVHYCSVGFNGCRISLMRRWLPVGSDGGRAYVVEEFHQDLSGDGILDLSQQRTNFYEHIPRPPISTGKTGALRMEGSRGSARRLTPTVRPAARPGPRAAPARG